jgi:hypothetical protein
VTTQVIPPSRIFTSGLPLHCIRHRCWGRRTRVCSVEAEDAWEVLITTEFPEKLRNKFVE